MVEVLVVVADHADARTQLVQRPDDRLLHRVHVLVFVHDDVLHPFSEPRSHTIVVGQEGHGLFEDRRVIEVALVFEQALVGREAVEQGAAVELDIVAFRFTQD